MFVPLIEVINENKQNEDNERINRACEEIISLGAEMLFF